MIDRLGRWALEQGAELVAMFLVPYAALKGAWLERGRGGRLVMRATAAQVYFTAVEPLPVFLVIAVSFGFFVVAMADGLMRQNGLAPYVPAVVTQAIVQELVPIVLAVMLTGRSGTAIATELGYMKVTQEVEALEASAVNIDYFLALPRVAGLVLASVGLTVLMAAAALIGGFWVAQGVGVVSPGLRPGMLLRAIGPAQIALALLKSSAFGVSIAAVSCFHGLQVERQFAEIPRANVRSAVRSFLICFGLNALLSLYALSRLR